MDFEKNLTSKTNQVKTKNENQIYLIFNAHIRAMNIVSAYRQYAMYIDEDYTTNIKTSLESFFKDYNQEFSQCDKEVEIKHILNTINETYNYLLAIPSYVMPMTLKQECIKLLIDIKNLANQRLKFLE